MAVASAADKTRAKSTRGAGTSAAAAAKPASTKKKTPALPQVFGSYDELAKHVSGSLKVMQKSKTSAVKKKKKST